jgi:hypothetical protein
VDPCSQCGDVGPTAYSDAASAVLCERCYGTQPSARYQRPTQPVRRLAAVKRPEPDAYQRLVDDVWAWMEADGYCQSMGTSPTVLVGRCPRCAEPMAARFMRRPTAEVRLVCAGGCDEDAIAAVLGRSNG